MGFDGSFRALSPGDILERRFGIVEIVGSGSYGVVYRAEDLHIPGAIWAVKEIREKSIDERERADAVRHFMREARLLSRLNHTGVPKVIEYFSSSDCHYMVMEFIEGETLEKKMTRALPDSASVVSWAIRICEIFEYLHGQKPNPLIYRDLKPSNIMITGSGRVMLIDFGTARYFNPRKTQDTCFLGTPGFCPPEQYGSQQSDVRNDIYALGATLYTLLSGVDLATLKYKVPPLSRYAPSAPGRLSQIIARCMSRAPEKRYKSVAHLSRDLVKFERSTLPFGLTLSSLAPQPIRLVSRVTSILKENPPKKADTRGDLRSTRSLSETRSLCESRALCRTRPLCEKSPLRKDPGEAQGEKHRVMNFCDFLLSKAFLISSSLTIFILLFLGTLFIIAQYYGGQYDNLVSRDRLTACKSNLKKIGVALNLYALDNGNRYPDSLSRLSPQYLESIPSCPAAQQSRYQYCRSDSPDCFTIWCEGASHGNMAGGRGFPRYSSDLGLIEDCRALAQVEALRLILCAFPGRATENGRPQVSPRAIGPVKTSGAQGKSIERSRISSRKSTARTSGNDSLTEKDRDERRGAPLSNFLSILREDGTVEYYEVPRATQSNNSPMFALPGFDSGLSELEAPMEERSSSFSQYQIRYDPGSSAQWDTRETEDYGFIPASDPSSGINDESFDSQKGDYGFIPASPHR